MAFSLPNFRNRINAHNLIAGIRVLLFVCLSGPVVYGQLGVLKHETITVGYDERDYWVYLPDHYSPLKEWPLILAFHGGKGTAKKTIKQYSFNKLADKQGFMVVYPNGINKGWNDGRIRSKKPQTSDDVKFILALLEKLTRDYTIDSHRIFSTGISNGAIFSIYLAYKIPDKILAIAPVCGSIPKNLENEFKLSIPVSAIFINGTKDKLIKYEGGPVISERADRGEVIAVEKSVGDWVEFNGCTGPPVEKVFPDKNKKDRCTAVMKTYSSCSHSTEVVFIKIDGGGHTWPGGRQYAPRFLIGRVCRDFKAEEVIWDFFKRQKVR